MDPELQTELLSCYNASLEWTQSFKIRQNNADIDLSWAVVQLQSHSICCQPTKTLSWQVIFQISQMLPWRSFLGIINRDDQRCTPWCQLYKICGPASQYKCYSLHCLHSVRNTSKSQTYNHDTYRQIGVKNETIKRTKTLGMLNSIERMSGKEETDTIWATKSSKVSGYSKNQPSKWQVHSGCKSSDHECCSCKIVYFMWLDGFTILITNLTLITMATDLFPYHFLFTKCTPYQMNHWN